MRIAMACLLACTFLLSCGCGGATPAIVNTASLGSSPTSSTLATPTVSTVTVSVTPTVANLETSYGVQKNTVQFTAIVQNAPDTSVRWYVDGILGGNSMVGTISEAGLYTAPEDVPPFPSMLVPITALPNADPKQFAQAIVSLSWYYALNLSAPEGTSVAASERLPLVLTVATRMPETRLIWTVNGVRSGTTRTGFVVPEAGSNTRVWYFAPHEAVAEPVVIAASRENYETKRASLSVSVVAGDPAPSFSIAPEQPTLGVTEQLRFRAFENGEERAVTWLVNGSQQPDARYGTFRENVYVAPFIVPPAGEALITAVDTSSTPNRFASTLVTIRPSANANARVAGTFAFHTQGSDRVQLGTLTFDGAGHVTGWMKTASVWDYGKVFGATFSGTYQTELNGVVAVSATLSEPITGWGDGLSLALSFVAPDLAEAWSDGYGFAERQAIATATQESFAGRFVAQLRSYYDAGEITCMGWGCSSPWTSEKKIGWLELDETGQFKAAIESPIYGSVDQFSSTIQFGEGGVATGGWNQITARTLLAIAVTKDRLMIAGVTGSSIFSGVADRQTMEPGLAALKGAYVFQTGRFVADGAGNLSGTLDVPVPGSVISFPRLEIGPPWKEDVRFTGKYAVDERGRVTMALAPETGDASGYFPKQPVLYLQNGAKHAWIDKAGSIGDVYRQSETPFEVGQVAGLYKTTRGAVGPMGNMLLIREPGQDAYGTTGSPAITVTVSFGAALPDGRGIVFVSAPDYIYGPTTATEKYVAVSPELLVFRTGAVLERFTWQ